MVVGTEEEEGYKDNDDKNNWCFFWDRLTWTSTARRGGSPGLTPNAWQHTSGQSHTKVSFTNWGKFHPTHQVSVLEWVWFEFQSKGCDKALRWGIDYLLLYLGLRGCFKALMNFQPATAATASSFPEFTIPVMIGLKTAQHKFRCIFFREGTECGALPCWRQAFPKK